jgi:hypothetical protein
MFIAKNKKKECFSGRETGRIMAEQRRVGSWRNYRRPRQSRLCWITIRIISEMV